MKRTLIVLTLTMVLILSCTTLVFASLNHMIVQETIKSFLRYNFDTVKEVPDNDFQGENQTVSPEGLVVFEPVKVSGGWIYDLAGGETLEAGTGSLEFNEGGLSERYIDIKGKNGEVRLLQNSRSITDGYTKTLFWSAKQQDGTSIVKGSAGDVKCAVLYELSDGSRYLYGYIEGDGTDFWSLKIPQDEYYVVKDFNG